MSDYRVEDGSEIKPTTLLRRIKKRQMMRHNRSAPLSERWSPLLRGSACFRLEDAGIETVADLAGKTAADLQAIPSIGFITANDLCKVARGMGLDVDPEGLHQTYHISVSKAEYDVIARAARELRRSDREMVREIFVAGLEQYGGVDLTAELSERIDAVLSSAA